MIDNGQLTSSTRRRRADEAEEQRISRTRRKQKARRVSAKVRSYEIAQRETFDPSPFLAA